MYFYSNDQLTTKKNQKKFWHSSAIPYNFSTYAAIH